MLPAVRALSNLFYVGGNGPENACKLTNLREALGVARRADTARKNDERCNSDSNIRCI